jgi:hypothetical protein
LNVRLNDVREDIPQIAQGPEVYVSHRWSRPAGEKLNKRAVQPRQVTNVKKLGAVYNVTRDKEMAKQGMQRATRENWTRVQLF